MIDTRHFGRVFRRGAALFMAVMLAVQPVYAEKLLITPRVSKSVQGADTGAPANPEILVENAGKVFTASGTRYMAVTAHPLATQVGAQILAAGGSAADAAVAVELVLGLVEPQSSGIGGGGFALYYDAKTGQVHTFDGRETAPATAGKYLFTGDDGKPMEFYDAAIGGRSVGVPGTLRLLELLHQRFGILPWRDLFSPAIGIAESGFQVSRRLAVSVDKDADHLTTQTAAKLYFFPDAATPIQEGSRLVNRPYASVLRSVATGGAQVFYNGPVAADIAKVVQEDPQNPGQLSVEDMASYEAIERKTVCGSYRGYLICSAGEPTSGGLALLATLGILENFDMSAARPEKAETWHLIGEASRLAFADRDKYMGDPHYVQSPGEMLIDKAYLKKRAALIQPGKANPAVAAGVPDGWKQFKRLAAEPVSSKPPGTSHFCLVDNQGNIVSMTDSVEDAFGSRLYVDGFMLNNQLTDFSFTPEVDGELVANRVEGGKRPRSTMTPVIMFAPDGRPAMVIGAAGGSAIMGYVLQRIIAIVDWRQNIATAMAAPNIVNRGRGMELEEGTKAETFEKTLEDYGHPVTVGPLPSGLTAITFDANRTMTGAADPRREGTAVGQ